MDKNLKEIIIEGKAYKTTILNEKLLAAGFKVESVYAQQDPPRTKIRLYPEETKDPLSQVAGTPEIPENPLLKLKKALVQKGVLTLGEAS